MSDIAELRKRIKRYSKEALLKEMGQHQPNNPMFHVYQDELKRREQRISVWILIVAIATFIVSLITLFVR